MDIFDCHLQQYIKSLAILRTTAKNIERPYLKLVKESGFRHLNFPGEPLDEILVDDPVRGGKEGQDVGDEMTFVCEQKEHFN